MTTLLRVGGGLGMTLLVGCLGGSPPSEPSGPGELPIDVTDGLPLSMSFAPIQLATDGPAAEIVASPKVRIAGQELEAGFTPLLRMRQELGGRTWGVVVDEAGEPLPNDDCLSGDYGGLLQAHGALWHVSHLECDPGGVWVTRLDQATDGTLSPVAGAAVDLSSVHGGKDFCGGATTPWGTLLSAEEYEPDAATVDVSGALEEQSEDPDFDPERLAAWHVPSHLPYVYDHGWITEIEIADSAGSTTVAKRYAMGRFSHELARLMPDGRTVYLSDDTTNGALFLFVADREGDLSAGTLYAARLTQVSESGGGQSRVAWISLGHTSEADVALELGPGTLHFDDLFETGSLDAETQACDPGFTSIVEASGRQCLRRVDGVSDAVAARFESRRMAALVGATTELRKAEGMAYDPDHDALYLSISRIDRGMTRASYQWDTGGPDHIGVAENRCGGVYALALAGGRSDTDGKAIDSPYVATSMRGFILGRPDGFGCADGVIANPDNLAYLPGSGVLLVAEDTDHHPNSLLWAIDVDALHSGGLASVTPILAVPPGGEVTGIDWFPDVGGFGYLTTTVQHPWEDHPSEEERTEEARATVFATWGPFPRLVVDEAAEEPAAEAPAPEGAEGG